MASDVTPPLQSPPATGPDGAGLTDEEARRRLAARGSEHHETGRSYASIVRANVLTVFNAILLGFGAVTLIFGDARDALFLAIIIANAAVGITQEVKAKRALDRLSLLVAPKARVRRGGAVRDVGVDEVVVDDVVLLEPGDQVVADGRLLSAADLRVDESILTGESEPAARGAGEELRSGAFVSEGTGAYEVTATGSDSFAARLTGEARSFRHPRSALEQAINRLLYVLTGATVFLGAVLGYSLYHRHVALHTAVSTSAAGVVSLIPEGLVLLVGVTYAAAAVRMSRRGVLAQQLNAIESLASVDTICVDKTGTLTEPSLRVVEVVGANGVSHDELAQILTVVAASASARNITLQAIADAYPGEAETLVGEVPFASRRRWSAVALNRGTFYLGAPGRVPVGALGDVAGQRQSDGRRVLALARGAGPLPSDPRDEPPAGLEPLGLVVLAEELRPGVGDTIQFLLEEGVEVKVLSGDAPATVAAIARDVGIPVAGVHDGAEIPSDPVERRAFAQNASVIGRISPEGKQAMIQTLADEGRYVAMIGDGVNDVPALKSSRLAIAQGSGTQMARSVSDLVLISGDFGVIPTLVSEGRRALRNLQRVTKLYVTKSAFAAFLILTIGTSSDAYPLLPRHLTLAGALTIGIPTFFLALAPSSGPWRPDGFVHAVARFAVPAGALTGVGLVAGYLFARHDLDLSLIDSRTVAVTILVACGLYLVLALESEGSRRRSSLVGVMCAVLAGLYVLVIALRSTRSFFELSSLDAGMVVTAVLSSAIAIGALAVSGFPIRSARGDEAAADG
jgi:cation-transporting P-type ATPase E